MTLIQQFYTEKKNGVGAKSLCILLKVEETAFVIAISLREVFSVSKCFYALERA